MSKISVSEIRKDILEVLASNGGSATEGNVINALEQSGEYNKGTRELLQFHIDRLGTTGSIHISSHPYSRNLSILKLTEKGEHELIPFLQKIFLELFSAARIANTIAFLIGTLVGVLINRLFN